MSGSLRVMDATAPPLAHDHFDIVLDSGRCLRFNDPRRFGCLLFTAGDPLRHRLLADLAVEPLSREFDGEALWRHARGRRVSIKAFIMDSRAVVGVGNIYASEALFRAGIRPGLAAGKVSRERMAVLVTSIREVLTEAIGVGGTTLRDYVDPSGMPGYFRQKLFVYERAGQPCRKCRNDDPAVRAGPAQHLLVPAAASARATRSSGRGRIPARRRVSASTTIGSTKCETSPPSIAISRTIVDEMKVNCSFGVRKT